MCKGQIYLPKIKSTDILELTNKYFIFKPVFPNYHLNSPV